DRRSPPTSRLRPVRSPALPRVLGMPLSRWPRSWLPTLLSGGSAHRVNITRFPLFYFRSSAGCGIDLLGPGGRGCAPDEIGIAPVGGGDRARADRQRRNGERRLPVRHAGAADRRAVVG